MGYINKHMYCDFIQCNKKVWLKNKNIIKKSAENKDDINIFNKVKEYACEYFGNAVEIPDNISKNDKYLYTKDLILKDNIVIKNASFLYDDYYSQSDILIAKEGVYSLVAVTTSTQTKAQHIDSLVFQYFVLSKHGLNVENVYVMCVNSNYARGEIFEIPQFLKLEECTEEIVSRQEGLELKLKLMSQSVFGEFDSKIEIGLKCEKPIACEFKGICHEDIPEDSVFSIARLTNKKKYNLYEKGIVTYYDLIKNKIDLSDKQLKQLKTAYRNEPPTIDKERIKEFLLTLRYPLYHIDFETFQQIVPLYKGIKPYMQIPFQFSIHVEESFCGNVSHFEFLSKEGVDPRRLFAEELCKVIPKDSCCVAYNMAFEKAIIKNLALEFQELSDHLMSLHDNMIDLMLPFKEQYYYSKELRGSYSIKKVLPALCQNDTQLDYTKLEEIHNGSEAMNAFLYLHNKSSEEIYRTRKNLLEYCKLDTLAMVKILEQLYIISEMKEENMETEYNDSKINLEDDEEEGKEEGKEEEEDEEKEEEEEEEEEDGRRRKMGEEEDDMEMKEDVKRLKGKEAKR